MNFKEALEKIEYIENRFPVEKWLINDFHIWPFLRLSIYNLYLSRKNPFTPKTDLAIIDKFKKIICSIWQAIIFEFKSLNAEVLTLGFASDYALVNNKYFNRNLDYFNYKFKASGIRITPLEIESKNIPFNSKSTSINISDSFKINILIITICLRIKNKIFKQNHADLKGFDELLIYLIKEGLKVDSITTASLEFDLIYRQAELSYFKRLLKRVKPKLIIVSYFLDRANNTLIAAGKQYGIKTMEIQHGIAGNVHSAYFKWNKFPKNGYLVFPDVFWTWGLSEASTINSWNYSNTNYKPISIPGGNVWLEAWRENLLEDFGISVLKYSKLVDKNEFNILLTLQLPKIPDIFFQLIKNSPKHYKWWIRIHPSLMSDVSYYDSIFSNMTEKVDFKNASEFPLFSILPTVNLHVTDFSSVAIEAAQFGVKTIFVSEDGAWLFRSFIPPEFIGICENSNDFLAISHKFYSKSNFDFSSTEGSSANLGFSILTNMLKNNN
jgi:hypothetical protein